MALSLSCDRFFAPFDTRGFLVDLLKLISTIFWKRYFDRSTHAFSPPAVRMGSLVGLRIWYRSSRTWSPPSSLIMSCACFLAESDVRGLLSVLFRLAWILYIKRYSGRSVRFVSAQRVDAVFGRNPGGIKVLKRGWHIENLWILCTAIMLHSVLSNGGI